MAKMAQNGKFVSQKGSLYIELLEPVSEISTMFMTPHSLQYIPARYTTKLVSILMMKVTRLIPHWCLINDSEMQDSGKKT